MNKEVKKMPLIPLRGLTIFPNMIISFSVGRQKSLEAIEKATNTDEIIFLSSQKEPSIDNPTQSEICEIGTIAKIKQILKLPGNITHIIVEGIIRGKIINFIEEERFDIVEIIEIEQDEDYVDKDTLAFMRLANEYFEEYVKLNNKSQSINEAAVNIISATKPGQMADIIISGLDVNQEKKQFILEIIEPLQRLKKVFEVLNFELEISKAKKEIEIKVKKNIEKSQKEYYLKEELKVIQEKLGDKDGFGADIKRYRKFLKNNKNIPEISKKVIEREISRLEKTNQFSQDANVIRNYIDWVIEMPWGKKTNEKIDIKNAQKILNNGHYGLEKVKERIIEYLAIIKNTPNSNTPILCLFGPPGVGKTSIAKSIALSLNRKYVRISLGGVKDESEIRGHRKTYIGAMPGRIIKAIKQAETDNPLILFDEIDKLSQSYNGDPASALLEVLDNEQNDNFRDHYMEIPYDLSDVLFICTANSIETISPPLRDRMEIIDISGYTSEEKKNIFKNYLYPKQVKKHGLKKSNIKISDDAIETIIDCYTKEAGVRQLERIMSKFCRKVVKSIVLEEKKSISVNNSNLERYIGRKKFRKEKIFDEPQVGVVRGLAWTQFGGDTLSIEVNIMKGNGKFEFTGNMGDIMKESAKVAISYIRTNSDIFNIEKNFYKEKDIHIHIPEGAVPKDGPSAGITMTTAIISALTNTKIRNDIAMTGEITIRGRVLPIGGVKEKVIAAKKAGVKDIIIPYDNKSDLEELSDNIKTGLEFILVKHMNDVLKTAIVKGENLWK